MYVSGEGTQRLVAMVRSQHQAWNDRLAARARLLHGRGREGEGWMGEEGEGVVTDGRRLEGRETGGVLQDKGREGGEGGGGRREDRHCSSSQSGSLSIYTMSSRYQ